MQAATAGPARLERLLEPLRSQPAQAGILCDIDGTLAPIVTEAAAATVLPQAKRLLATLAGRYALVACVTGRRALVARDMVGVEAVAYAGNHGFELLQPGAGEAELHHAVRERAAEAARFVDGLDGEWLDAAGLRREDKGPIQSLHWRGADREELARGCAEEVAKRAAEAGLYPRWGRLVLELRPVEGIDKGSATAGLLRGAGAGHALFGGDDLTDLDAFAALAELRDSGRLRTAISVGVASPEQPPGLAEAADVMVQGPEGFLAVLEELARA